MRVGTCDADLKCTNWLSPRWDEMHKCNDPSASSTVCVIGSDERCLPQGFEVVRELDQHLHEHTQRQMARRP